MKIDDNSNYIKYEIKKGKECAYMSHYGEVWEDGFAVENYDISNNNIYYEDAVWNGHSAHIDNCWKRILARDFNRWRDEINKTKQNLIDKGTRAGTEIVKELKEGDYVFIAVHPYDLEDEFERIEYCFLEVDSVDNNFVCGKQMYISTYFFAYSYNKMELKGEDYWLDCALDENNVIRIDKSEFYLAVEDFHRLTTKLMSEIKKMYHGIL